MEFNVRIDLQFAFESQNVFDHLIGLHNSCSDHYRCILLNMERQSEKNNPKSDSWALGRHLDRDATIDRVQ